MRRLTSLDMDQVELIRPEPEQFAELGRICYEAFLNITRQHGFPHDIPDPPTAAQLIDNIMRFPGAFGVAARIGGKLAGSNFLLMTDSVAGLGPITVDPACHARGIGRRLMQAALDHAQARGFKSVRLMQDSYNAASLSLYASMGFDIREPIAMMRAAPATPADGTVRKAQLADLPVMEELCVRHYKVSRRNELAAKMKLGVHVMLRERSGKVRGYLLPGKMGHGVAETEEDMLALIGQVSNYTAPGMDVFFCPLRNTSLYRATLKAGCRLIKVMMLMSHGTYEEPAAAWTPSISY